MANQEQQPQESSFISFSLDITAETGPKKYRKGEETEREVSLEAAGVKILLHPN